MAELQGIHRPDGRTRSVAEPSDGHTAVVRDLTTPMEPDLSQLGHLNFVEFNRESSRWSEAGHLVEKDGVLLVATGSAFPVLCNGAFRIDDQVPAAVVLDVADQWFSELGRGYTLSPRTLDVDVDLVRAAVERGLHELHTSPEMVCRSRLDEREVPSGVELRWVESERDVDDFIAVNTAAYATLGMPTDVMPAVITPSRLCDVPHLHTVVAYVDDRPVAAAQTMLSHGIAGVYWVGTVESGRGRGVGEAVTRAVTNRAFDLGAAANTLQASPMGAPIYARMGYETIYDYRTFVRFEPA
jgi:hypothetical protein